MNVKTVSVVMGAITAFVITAGGALGIACWSLHGAMPDTPVWVGCIVLGLVAAAKDTRSQLALPPLSNGNLDALKQLYAANPNAFPPVPQQQPAQQGTDSMKPIVSLIAIATLAIGLTANAQNLNTNGTPSIEGPAMDAIKFLSASATNWMVAPYGIATSEGKYGGGIAAAYRLSDYVAPTLRLDYLDGRVWMPSADLQLQAPITLFGKLTLIPFAFTGIATPIAGKGADNGTVVGMFGAGAAVRLSSHIDLVGDVEKWTGFSGQQYRFGLLYKF